MEQQFKYFAFISYNSKDTEWGKRVQRKLEHYRMPATLCSERGWERTPIKPIFFAPTDIQPGGLTEELQERLRASRNLIVICSPNSAQSEWVGREIEFFHQLGRTAHIHFFIVDGEPHSGNPETECFNPIVKQLGLPEILGANIHEKIYRWPWLNKERAYVQLISKLLGVEFDAIWQRHRRLLIEKAIAWSIGICAVLGTLAGVWITNQPVDVAVRLNEASSQAPNLPSVKEAVVTMVLDNETKTDTIHAPVDHALFTNIPHRFLDKDIHITASLIDANGFPSFQSVDTIVHLTREISINIYRDARFYGDVHFQLYDPMAEQYLAGVNVQVMNQTYTSDEEGQIRFSVPLEQQRPSYPVAASIPLSDSLITMPCHLGSIPTLLKSPNPYTL